MFSNDASLLLPTHALGVSHFVLSSPRSGPFDELFPGFDFGPANRGYVTVVGVTEGTNVGVTPTADMLDGVALSSAGCAGPATDGVFNSETYVAWTCDIADGMHEVIADNPVVIYVYGYYAADSYTYPGGAGLN